MQSDRASREALTIGSAKPEPLLEPYPSGWQASPAEAVRGRGKAPRGPVLPARQRAAVELLFEEVRTGRVGVPALFESPSRSMPAILYTWRCIRENQTLHLAHTTRMVELAKRPAAEQGAALQQYADGVSGQNPGWLKFFYFFPFQENFVLGRRRLAVATPYRPESGRAGPGKRAVSARPRGWPKSAADLVPTYLEAIPYDSYTGGSLHWKPLGKRLLIYSGRADRVIGVGEVFNARGLGKNVGFVLEPQEDRRESRIGAVKWVACRRDVWTAGGPEGTTVRASLSSWHALLQGVIDLGPEHRQAFCSSSGSPRTADSSRMAARLGSAFQRWRVWLTSPLASCVPPSHCFFQ